MTNRTFAACAAVTLLLAGTACNPPARHAALTFFFDGVPPLQAPPAPGQEVAAAGAAAQRPVVRYREHGPYAAKLCNSCHESTSGNRFVAPREKLCAHCHDLGPDKKIQHNPMASGDCLSCHDAHSSRQPFLLIAEVTSVCSGCHEKDALPQDAVHTEAGNPCNDCHDPHQSDNENLLR